MLEFLKDKKIFYSLLGVVILCAMSIGAVFYAKYIGKNENVLAIVGDKKITKDDLSKALYGFQFSSKENATDKEKKMVLDRLIEREIATKELAKLKLFVTEDEIQSGIKSRLGDQYNSYSDSQKKMTQSAVKGDLAIEKVKASLLENLTGKFVIIRFDQAKAQKVANEDAKYATDKEYAKNLADKLYADLKNKKITIEQAMTNADNDATVGKPAWVNAKNYPFSVVFSKENPLQGDSEFAYSTDFKGKAFALSNGLNAPGLASIKDQDVKTPYEAFYFIGNIDNINKGAKSYEEWLSTKKNEYKL